MGRKNLSWPPNGGSVYAIEDIGDVIDDIVDDDKMGTIVAAKVIGVNDVDIL